MCIGLLPGILLNTWPSLFCLFLAWIWSLVAKQTLVGAKIRQPNCDKTYLSSTKRRYLFKNNWIYPRVSVSHMHLSSLFLLCKIWTNIDQLIRLHSDFQPSRISTAAQFCCKWCGVAGEEFKELQPYKKLLMWMVKSRANRYDYIFWINVILWFQRCPPLAVFCIMGEMCLESELKHSLLLDKYLIEEGLSLKLK